MRIRKTRREAQGLAPSEHTEAVRFFRVVQLHEVRQPELLNLTHVPMGGKRHRTVAMKLKNEGMRRGYPDYLLDVPRGGYHGWRCELKAEKGTAEPHQKAWHERLRAQGYRVDVCRGWEEAWRALCDYLGIPCTVI